MDTTAPETLINKCVTAEREKKIDARGQNAAAAGFFGTNLALGTLTFMASLPVAPAAVVAVGAGLVVAYKSDKASREKPIEFDMEAETNKCLAKIKLKENASQPNATLKM